MKDDILNILKNKDKAMDVIEIQDALGLKESKELEELIKILNEMEEEALLYHTKKDMGLSLGDTVYVILNDRGIFKLTVSDIMIDLSAYDSYPVGDSVTLYLKDDDGNSYQMYTYADINRWVFRTEEAAKEMYDVLCEEKAQQRLEWDNVQSSEIN